MDGFKANLLGVKYMNEIHYEDEREYEVKHYKGKEILYNFYCEDEYSVDGRWFMTLEAAMDAIDHN